MYVKRFKLGHLRSLAEWYPSYDLDAVPALGWVVIEHERILAYGFFREVEGNMAAVEGPYVKPDCPRAVHAGQMLEKEFMYKAIDLNVKLVRIKPYRP